MERYIRTDLAVELQEEISEKSLLQGVEIFTRYSKDRKIKETKIDVIDEQGAKISYGFEQDKEILKWIDIIEK